MNKQAKTRVCITCGAHDMEHDTRNESFEYKGQSLLIPSVSGWFCRHCGEAYLDDAAAYSKAISAFAKQVDLQEAKTLARVRRKLKLTQHEAAMLTGGGPNAFSRYENGKAKPMPAIINLFKLLDLHPDLLNELRKA